MEKRVEVKRVEERKAEATMVEVTTVEVTKVEEKKEGERGREWEGGLEWRNEGEGREKRDLTGNECREWLDLLEVRKSGPLCPCQQTGHPPSSLWAQGWLDECGSSCTGRCA